MTVESRPNLPVSDRRAYRRGQILGLTIAEFFLVLSFLLLLLLGFWITEFERETAILRDLQAKIQERGLDLTADKLLAEIERIDQLHGKIDSLEKELQLVRERELALSKRVETAEAQAALRESQLKELQDEKTKLTEEVAKAQDLLDVTKNMNQQEVKNFIELVKQVDQQTSDSKSGVEELSKLLSDQNAIETVRQIASRYTESNSKIADGLAREFAGDLDQWNAQLDKGQLVVRFNNPDVLFEQGQATLKPRFRVILSEFCPRYLKLLSEYDKKIAEIRIEGHTSSEWRETVSGRQAYFLNMALSQARTRAALEYCLGLTDVGPIEDWSRSTLVAVGMSSSRPIRDTQEQEDQAKSRRVEFRVVTDAAASIGEIIQQVHSEGN